MVKDRILSKIITCAALAVFALVSFFPLAGKLSAPELYAGYAQSIDDKTETVLRLTATATVTSAGISAIPGDTATPIADKLADFSEYFLLILCVLYAEKYLLAIIPLGVFRILLPLSCLAFITGRFWNPRLMDRQGRRLLLISAALFFVIPLSVQASDLIYKTYQDSIDTTIAAAESLNEQTEELAQAEDDTNLMQKILGGLKETASSLTDKAAETLNRFVETLAVMIVTSCVIPILVLLFVLWVVRRLTGIDPEAFHPGKRRPD